MPESTGSTVVSLPPSPPTSNGNARFLLIAVVVVVVAVVVGIVVLSVDDRPTTDVITIIGLLTAFVTTTLVSLYAAVKTAVVNDKVQELKLSVDGRLTQLLAVTARAEHAEGVSVGVQREQGHVASMAETAATAAATVLDAAATTAADKKK
jgi:hypothetical protein